MTLRELAWAAAAVGLSLGGCAAPRVAPAAQRSARLDVPFVAGSGNRCGPATLASVLQYWGLSVGPGELKKVVYLPRVRGALPSDLVLAAQAHGLQAEAYAGDLDDLREKLAAGEPVIVFLRLGRPWYPSRRFAVVTGYDDARGGVFARSGQARERFVSYPRFLRAWDKTGRWTLVVRPGGQYGQR